MGLGGTPGGRRETQEAGTLATNTVADRLDKRTKVGLHHLREGGVRDHTKMSAGPTHGECLGVRRGDAGHTCRICEYTVQIGQASVRQPMMHIMLPARASRKYVLCLLACAIER